MSEIKNVTVISSSSIRLDEDAKSGDIIDFKNINKVDLKYLDNAIKDAYLKEYDKEKANLEMSLDSKYKIEILKKEHELNKLHQGEIDKLKEEILKLKNDSLKKEEELKLKEQMTTLQVSKKYDEEILKLKQEIVEKQNEMQLRTKLKDEETKNLLIEKENILRENFLSELKKKDEEISKLKLTKTGLNTKQLGEELEKWCNDEFQNYRLAGFDNTSREKANKEVEGTKPDYIFKIFEPKSHEILSSVCLEMKNQGLTGKTKNSDHYKKLDEDRVKQGCEYALLVSELEWNNENDAPIRKIPEYEKMYMVRPQYFVTFLQLIYSITMKYKDLLEVRIKEEKEFKNKNEILEQFESFKNTYLDKPLKSVVEKVNSIKENAFKIQKNNENTITVCNELLDKRLFEIKEKIERFDIKKIANKVEKLENK